MTADNGRSPLTFGVTWPAGVGTYIVDAGDFAEAMTRVRELAAEDGLSDRIPLRRWARVEPGKYEVELDV